MYLIRKIPLFTDNEFTQLMKGLQGERLRQAFKYLDANEDGFINPEQFKSIILVRFQRSHIVPMTVKKHRK